MGTNENDNNFMGSSSVDNSVVGGASLDMGIMIAEIDNTVTIPASKFSEKIREYADRDKVGSGKNSKGEKLNIYDYDIGESGFKKALEDLGVNAETTRIKIVGGSDKITSIRNMDFEGIDFSNFDFENVRLVNCNLHKCKAQGAIVSINSDLNPDAGQGSEFFKKVTISNSELDIQGIDTSGNNEKVIFSVSTTVANTNLSDDNLNELRKKDRKDFNIYADLNNSDYEEVKNIYDDLKEGGVRLKYHSDNDSKLLGSVYDAARRVSENPDINNNGEVGEDELEMQKIAQAFLKEYGDLTEHSVNLKEIEVKNDKMEANRITKLAGAINNTKLGGGCMTKDVCR